MNTITNQQEIMKKNQTLITATSIILAYAGFKDKMGPYIDVLKHLSQHFALHTAKSIRYENDFKHLKSVTTQNSKKVDITCPTTDGEMNVTVVEYYVREETVPRYAFFSDKFTKAFSFRYFDKYAGIARLNRQPWIDARREMLFWNSSILEYRSQDSNIERYAIHFADSDRTYQDFIDSVRISDDKSSAERTSFFAEE